MLIPGKSHSRDDSHNSRVSIETLDFARVRTFTCVIGVGSPAGARMGGGVITGRIRRRSQSITGPHCRLRMINIAGSGAPKRPGEGTGKRNSHRLPDDGPGITASPHQTSVDNRSTSRAGWVRETAGSGRVSAPWHTCQKADMQRDGGLRSPTGCRVWETTGPPSDAAGRSADIVGGRHI